VLSTRRQHCAAIGNERFRTLVQSRYDDDYCASYTTLRNDVAEEIIHFSIARFRCCESGITAAAG
jgi:hypothetical protein